MKLAVFALGLALALPVAARAMDTPAGDLVVGHPWARATAATAKVGGAFLDVSNRGPAADRLVSAQSPIAERVELHQTVDDKGVMRMRELAAGVPLPPGGTIQLKPGGIHLMLMGLKQPLKQGQDFPLTLVFERAGKVDLQGVVVAAGASSAGHQGGHKH